MPTVIELKEQRNRLIEQARALIEHAESENRDFTATEQEQSDRVDTDIASMTRRIDRQERQEQLDRDLAEPPDRGGRPDQRQGREDGEDLASQFRALANGERRAVTVDFNADDLRAQRDLTVGVNTAGGNTVPQTFVRRLYDYLVERSAIRQTNVTVLTTGSGEQMLIPTVTAHGSAGLVAEGAVIPEGDPAFGQVALDAYKYGQLLDLSSELITDTGVDLLGFIARDAGRALGEATGAHYLNGTGTGQPAGIVGASTVGVTTAAGQTASINAENLMDLFFSVIGPYRRNAYWMMNDSTLAEAAKLTDGSGRYLLDPLTTGTPLSMRGRPIVTDHNMPELAAGNRVVLFGDFSGYYIRDVGRMRFERSDQFRFDTDLTTFRSIMRTDGQLVDTTGAVKHLATAAV